MPVLLGHLPKTLSVLATNSTDIGPLIDWAARTHGLDPYLLAALCQAESGLQVDAARVGIWPDISFGLTQITVRTARYYGLGDGTNTPENIAEVRRLLFQPEVALEAGALHLEGCLVQAQNDPLQALIAYNSGSPQPEGNWYWQRYPSNIRRYQAALSWAATLRSDQ